jgi:ATP-dependent Clp protease protease subunit
MLLNSDSEIIEQTLIKILAKHTGRPFDKIKKDINCNHYLTAKEALNYGLIDKIKKRI